MRARYISKDDLQKLKKSMSKSEWLPFQVMLETGLRVGDVAGLRKSDLHVCDDGRYKITFIAQKTGKYGDAYITEATWRQLKAVRTGFLFSGRRKGTHITRQALWGRVKRAAARAGIELEGKSPHSFRKDFAVEKNA